MTIQFWLNEPTILFNKEYLLDLWPTENMCYIRKLNSISRLIILITLLGYLITNNIKILITGIITLIILVVMSKTSKQKLTKEMLYEGFHMQENEKDNLTLKSVLKTEFKEGTKKNPFSNVLLTDIQDIPERKSAPPAFNPTVEENITKHVKKSVQFNNPEIKNTNKQIFGDLYENWELDQSNRSFYSTANTTVQPGDQASFAQYLYGQMPSAKESNSSGNLQREKDNLYTSHFNLY
jgi:hypothetical protein